MQRVGGRVVITPKEFVIVAGYRLPMHAYAVGETVNLGQIVQFSTLLREPNLEDKCTALFVYHPSKAVR